MLLRSHLSSLPQKIKFFTWICFWKNHSCQPPSLFHKTTGPGKSLRELLQTSVLEKHSSGKPRSGSAQPETHSYACDVIRGKVTVRKKWTSKQRGGKKEDWVQSLWLLKAIQYKVEKPFIALSVELLLISDPTALLSPETKNKTQEGSERDMFL